MTTPITLPPLDVEVQTELRRLSEETGNPATRTRYQMILLAQRGQIAPQIARPVLHREDTAERVLNRFIAGGLDAVPGVPHQGEGAQ